MRRGGGRSERGEERRGGRWRGEGEGGRGRGGRHEGEGVREMPERPVREPEDVGPSVGTATTPLTAVGQFVCGVIERMGMGSFSISESGETEGLTAIQIHGGAAARLASGDGRAMDAIQLLANQVSLRTGGDDARRVVLDVEGDADQRATFLARIASRAAQRAKETGRPVALEPMSPRDRRTVHVALREEEGIATMSVGESRYRQVVVVPESAPEYEEAKRYEAESQRESRD
jgi:spoIIIJ-associated protein